MSLPVYILIVLLSSATLTFAIMFFRIRRVFLKYLRRNIMRSNNAKVGVFEAEIEYNDAGESLDNALLNDLRVLLEQKKLYRRYDITVKIVAKELGTNKSTLSHVVNRYLHRNFSKLINDYRIEEAVSLLSQKKYDAYKVESIGEMCGFINRQVFHRAFKIRVGITPTKYRDLYSKNHIQQ